ncbi:MAG: prepilin-type N-terminal cleavage/methylation domain-containing protein [Candidatus Saccharibacteria bacterium]
MTDFNKSGFSIIELVIVVVVVGLIGALGYTFYNRQQATNQATSTSRNADVASAPEIKTATDLNAASKVLDATTVGDEGDNAQLDSELNNF